MSQRKLPQKKSRNENLILILEYLAKNKEVPQGNLPDVINRSYRTVMRDIHTLERLYLVEIVRRERSSKRGKEKNIWRATFQGLLLAFTWLRSKNENIDEIAENHKDEWIIFQEWDYISEDSEARSHVEREISSESRNNPFWVESWFRASARKYSNLEYYDFALVGPNLDDYLKQTVATKALALNKVSYGLFLMGETMYERPPICKFFDFFIQNPRLREFIVEQIQFFEDRYFFLQDLKRRYDITTNTPEEIQNLLSS